jgi:hypothetical protein
MRNISPAGDPRWRTLLNALARRRRHTSVGVRQLTVPTTNIRDLAAVLRGWKLGGLVVSCCGQCAGR